jgi:pimeloyl-ACP methyl ester carboxylesterase
MPVIGKFRYLEALPPSSARQGRTLVLIHAFPLDERMWEPQLALAEAGWRVIAPHLRGTNGGQPEAAVPTMDDFAADVIDLLDALHIENAVIGGLSMGGYVTFALFRHAPRYFRGMILADTRPQADTPEAVEGRKRLLAVVREKGAAAVAEEMVPKLLGETTRRERPDIAAHVGDLVRSNSADAIAGAISALMSRPDSTTILSTIHCPTLIIVGEEDTITPPPLSHDMKRAIGGAELVVVPRAGHLSSIEQAAAFNAALAQFLEHRV